MVVAVLQVLDMQDWRLAVADIDKTVNIDYLVSEPEQLDSGHSIGVDLTDDDTHQKVVYFSAPQAFLGNKLSAYGGALNYTIFYTTGLFGTLNSALQSYRPYMLPKRCQSLRLQIGSYLLKPSVGLILTE
jgi:hypothetical protein